MLSEPLLRERFSRAGERPARTQGYAKITISACRCLYHPYVKTKIRKKNFKTNEKPRIRRRRCCLLVCIGRGHRSRLVGGSGASVCLAGSALSRLHAPSAPPHARRLPRPDLGGKGGEGRVDPRRGQLASDPCGDGQPPDPSGTPPLGSVQGCRRRGSLAHRRQLLPVPRCDTLLRRIWERMKEEERIRRWAAGSMRGVTTAGSCEGWPPPPDPAPRRHRLRPPLPSGGEKRVQMGEAA